MFSEFYTVCVSFRSCCKYGQIWKVFLYLQTKFPHIMNLNLQFQQEIQERNKGLAIDPLIRQSSLEWINKISHHKWAYNFSWMGRPAIQFPNDSWAMQ